MSVLAAFVSHELTTQFRSARFKILALTYISVTCIPAVAIYLASRNIGYALDGGAYAWALRIVQPSLTALFATVLAVDAITREREEGSFGVISLAPMTGAGYVFRRWVALLAIALPLTLVPVVIAAGLAAHAEHRLPSLAPLGWEWLFHVLPPLLVMSALMLALGTITGRTILAILAYGAAMTFGLGFLQDGLALMHRRLDGPGEMIGFNPDSVQRLFWAIRGWWRLEPPTVAGYPIEEQFDALLPESALIAGLTILFICAAPAFLRRTRPDVKPRPVRDDHPLRTMLRGFNRVREDYRPDGGLHPVDRAIIVAGLAGAMGCVAYLLDRESHYIDLARERYAAEQAIDPREMSVFLVPRSIRVEGEAGRVIRAKTTFEMENRGANGETHLGFGLHRGLEIQNVTATCGKATVTREWERLGIDLDRPIPPSGTCRVTLEVAGKPDAIVFNLSGKGRFGNRYRLWQRATTAIDLSDLSRSTFAPAATRHRLLLKASDFAPVPRYTPWVLETQSIDRDDDTTSFIADAVGTVSDVSINLRLPDAFTAVDSCGAVSTRRIDSRCALAFSDFRVIAARYTVAPLGAGTLVYFPRHDDLARVHAPAMVEALTIAQRAWPGLNITGTPVFIERPINGDGERASYYRPWLASPIEASGSMYSIAEWLFIQRKPLDAPQIGSAIISSTLHGRRAVEPEERPFFLSFFQEVARSRIGASDTRSAVAGGKGPLPSTSPLREIRWASEAQDRLRGVLVDLEYRVGADRLVDGVNEFAAGNGNGTSQELLETIGRRANVDLANMYRDYFAGSALPKLTLEEATFVREGKRWTVRGFVHNLATGEAVCPVVLRTQFGSVRQTVVVGTGQRVPFSLSTEYEPRTLQLDPDRVVYRHAAIGTVDAIDYEGES